MLLLPVILLQQVNCGCGHDLSQRLAPELNFLGPRRGLPDGIKQLAFVSDGAVMVPWRAWLGASHIHSGVGAA